MALAFNVQPEQHNGKCTSPDEILPKPPTPLSISLIGSHVLTELETIAHTASYFKVQT